MARPKSYQRETVICQVLDVFWRKGFAATSLSDLTEATGLNKRSLYNEFGSKEALFLTVLEHYRKLQQPVIELLLRKPLGMQNIHDAFEVMAGKIDSRGCLIALCLNERELLGEQVLNQVTRSVTAMRQLFLDNLASVEFVAKVDREALACLLGMQSLAIAGMGRMQAENCQVQAMVKQFLAILPKPVKG
ncbi:TetR/AcrR family transcriptional regulator [Spongorhabdus nitratireducens]